MNLLIQQTRVNISEEQPLTRQCAWCRKVKDDQGSWVESDYLPLASHGICPTCLSIEMQKIHLVRKVLVSHLA